MDTFVQKRPCNEFPCKRRHASITAYEKEHASTLINGQCFCSVFCHKPQQAFHCSAISKTHSLEIRKVSWIYCRYLNQPEVVHSIMGHNLRKCVERAYTVKPQIIYSRICLIRHLKGIRKKWRITQTGENSIIEARMLYHRNSYAYIVVLFAVKYKFMTLCLNKTINSSALGGLLHSIKHLLNL